MLVMNLGSQSARGALARSSGCSWGSLRRPAMRSSMLRATQQRGCRCEARADNSQLVFQELILFIFQQEFDCQLQRALNYEDYTEAQNIRQKRQTVDEALGRLLEHKGSFSGMDPASSSIDELSSEGVSLRVQLQKAIFEERYTNAAGLRDRLQQVQELTDAAAAKRSSGVQPMQPVRLKLGQRVTHADAGYRGLIFGWDQVCCEDDEWRAKVGVETLSDGTLQPFYHVLIDEQDWSSIDQESIVAYVPQEKLIAPQWPSTWRLEKGGEKFQHPHLNFLFLGEDDHANYLPTRALRDKYGQPRGDVHPPEGQPGGP